MTTKIGITQDPEHLISLAKQLRDEATRAEARAAKIKSGEFKLGCASGCWNVLCTCIKIQPL